VRGYQENSTAILRVQKNVHIIISDMLPNEQSSSANSGHGLTSCVCVSRKEDISGILIVFSLRSTRNIIGRT